MSLRCFYFCSRRCTSKSSSCPSIYVSSLIFLAILLSRCSSPNVNRLSSSIACSSFLLDSTKFCTHVIYLFFRFFFFLVCSFNLLRNYNCVRSVNSIELQCYNIENLSVQCGSHWCLCACAVSFQIYRFSCETKCVRACTWCVRVSVTLGSSMSQLNVL